jgi:hypothetical protein
MQETYQKGFTLTERGISSVSMATPVFTIRLCILIVHGFTTVYCERGIEYYRDRQAWYTLGHRCLRKIGKGDVRYVGNNTMQTE